MESSFFYRHFGRIKKGEIVSLQPFDGFIIDHQEEIKKVQALLEQKLSDLPGQAEEQGREAEAWIGRMSTFQAFANSYVAISREVNREGRGKEITDHDREIMLAKRITDEVRLYEVIKGLVDALKIRVSFVQSLIKAENINRGKMTT